MHAARASDRPLVPRSVSVSVALASILVTGFVGRVAAADLACTVIDRSGNRHELTKVQLRGRSQFEFYVGERRRVVSLKDIKSIRFEGDEAGEEQAIRVEFPSGRVENGVAFTGGRGRSPNQDSIGGVQPRNQLSGSTALGPFIIPLSNVREIIFRAAWEHNAVERQLRATVVSVKGEMSEVRHLTYRGQSSFDFSQGRKRRSVDLARVSRLEFADDRGGETRSVTITLASAKQIQGTVEASIFRLSGELDKQFERRVGSAFIGETSGGPFAIGMHDVKLILFHADEEDEGAAAADTTAGSAADTLSVEGGR